jgi:hypothetical protein
MRGGPSEPAGRGRFQTTFDPVERRGQAIRVMITLVNWQQEEPIGYGGGRQLSMDGTSRVTGDIHARICERLGVQIPGATRRRSVMVVPTAPLALGGGPQKNPTSQADHTFDNRQVAKGEHPGSGLSIACSKIVCGTG